MFENLEKLIKRKEFEKNGYFVIDDALTDEQATSFAKEIKNLQELNKMKPNKVQFLVKNAIKPIVVIKPGIFEADLYDKNIINLEILKNFKALFEIEAENLAKLLNKTLNLNISTNVSGRVVKLQFNDGSGGCFPFHYDNPGKPNKRLLTCAFYLNKYWNLSDGGELILLPFLQKQVNISPIFNRLVIFRSDSVLHKVLPSLKERLCFTIWFDGFESDVNKDEDCLLKLHKDKLDLDSLKQYFVNKPVQRLISRLVYNEEFIKSLEECFINSKTIKDKNILLKQHLQRVKSLASNKPLLDVINTLRHSISKQNLDLSLT